MIIRDTVDSDLNTLVELHREAFGETEGDRVARLAVELLQDSTARPLISLVASVDGLVVGHVIFSKVSVEGDAERSGYILAPLAVHPAFQRRGIGTALIRRGIERLTQLKADYVLVLGNPDYYQRAGFTAAHAVLPPYELDYPEAWMILRLNQDGVGETKGVVRCAKALCWPELW
ncbi:MAG: N-acetyltransferase [Candidatus Thiodiazotropha taylori]|nr:N-acetyltransferase [Candidatus Thiodiazotropha taylori]MCW4243926.1 N-acetyltransferase [Candidatus Thiodiazotropha taylori]